MERKENDLRYQRTETLIRRVFYEMIEEMDYRQMTIKELAGRAGINRKTFYLHYVSLDELLAELQIGLLAPILQSTIDYRYPADLESAVREWLLFWDSVSATESKVLTTRGNYPAGKNPMEFFIENTCDFFQYFSAHPAEKSLLTTYWWVGFQSLFARWAEDGRKIPMEDLISFVCRLFSQGISNIGLSPAIPE